MTQPSQFGIVQL